LKAQKSYHLAVQREQPRVGITTYREGAVWGVWGQAADLLPANYSDAVAGAGAVPMLLSPAAVTDPDGAAQVVIDGLHGLVLAGGGDIDPARYAAARDRHTGPPRSDRDHWELALVHAALERQVPIFAICRGMQILNVALGGDIIQHLPDVVGHDGHRPVIGRFGRHDVTFADGSQLVGLLGRRASVATYHHQAVGRLGDSLVATAWADDQTVEAVEYQGGSWVLGVQWHPEVHDGAALFAAFVDACLAPRGDVAMAS
jgi:gamma-glutamyl-gamma-aminobutyrate hydrolase PuuD